MADTLSASKDALMRTTTLPLQLNNLLEVARDAGMARYLLANLQRPVMTTTDGSWDGELA